MNNNRETIIQPEVFSEAEIIYKYIKQDSPQNADLFKQELLAAIEKVEANPEGCPSEDYLNAKRIIYRFTLVMRRWKLIFKTTKELLVFIGIVHTSRHPKEIRKIKTTQTKKKGIGL